MLGSRIREAREAQSLSVRELARKVDCSPSMISQIERSRANPSVSTLYEITNALQISLDALFTENTRPAPRLQRSRSEDPLVTTGRSSLQPPVLPRPATPAGSDHPAILRPGGRRVIDLAHGVRWELLVPVPERNAEFMEVYYAAGGDSVERRHALRHNGREYGVVIEGVLSAELGFECYELGPGDSVAFDSTVPHRYWNAGNEPVRGIWFVLDRWQVSDPGWDGELRSQP